MATSDLYYCSSDLYVAADSSATANVVYAQATSSNCSSVTTATSDTHTTWGVDSATSSDTTHVSHHVYYPKEYIQRGYTTSGTATTTSVTTWTVSDVEVTREQVRIIINGIEYPGHAIVEEEGTIIVGPDGTIEFRDWYFRGSEDVEFGQFHEGAWGYKETKEQKEARELREALRDGAEIKAKDLLKSFIGQDELDVYNKTGRLYVKGKKNEYIVRKGRTVQLIEKDKIVDLCVHLKNRTKFPETDNVVALKIMLEYEEDAVLKLANRVGTESLPEELPLAACM